MADFIKQATDVVESIVEGSDTTPPLPQIVPEGRGPRTGYDRAVDAVNRLPRPVAALLALALFLDAAIEPVAFAQRMQILATIPEPLWWLIGAVLTFFFGARETHYLRRSDALPPKTSPPGA
jgi:Holin of 3TMs, for gene-transfer release